VFYFVKYSPIKYGKDYSYPGWGEAMGFGISLSSMIWVPGYAVYYLLTTEGSWREVLKKGITPIIKPRPEAILAEEAAKKRSPKDVEMRLIEDGAEAHLAESL